MAYYSLHAYDADVFIPSFAGLQQYGPGFDGDVRYAVEEYNLETPAGVLQPMAAPELLQYSFTNKIETLAHLYRRWYSGNDDKDVLIAATDGKLYYLTSSSSGWVQLGFPSGVTGYQCNVWSYVVYEINPAGSTSPVDIILMSNAKDGMVMIRGDNFTVTKVETPKNFGVIERHAERIWGGAIEDDPDTLMYSRPFDPTDWTQAGPDEEPEDGAGEVMQPSWDGDSFTALRQFGNQLIAFKKHRVWRILGTDPGEYTFKEQYGGGAPFPNTISVDISQIFMLEREGMSIYDGMSVTPMYRENIEDLWKTVNKNAIDQACGVMFNQKYYLAFPTGNSTINNALLIFNIQEGSILYFNNISIESFLAAQEKLYATSATLPGKVMILHWDSWTTGSCSNAATKWVSPWMTLGKKSIRKGGYDIYFQPEVQTQAVTLKFSIQTEKKIKSKNYTISPLTQEEVTAGKGFKMKRLHIGGVGRRFRLIIETTTGITKPWRLVGGLQIIAETDPD